MMKRLLVVATFLIALAIAALLPVVKPVEASGVSSQPAAQEDVNANAASKDYCVSNGGEVDNRQPYYNTNGPEQDWLRLSGSRNFCKFTSPDDGSRIHVELSTLYTTKPSLAALAYYAEVPIGTCNGNPASCYCTLLGGSDSFGGINAAGGGWVQKSDPVDTVLEACIFPDMSSIDSWGLTYHSVGIIRGADLDGILRYPNPYASKKRK
jgi:putative hemolysin